MHDRSSCGRGCAVCWTSSGKPRSEGARLEALGEWLARDVVRVLHFNETRMLKYGWEGLSFLELVRAVQSTEQALGRAVGQLLETRGDPDEGAAVLDVDVQDAAHRVVHAAADVAAYCAFIAHRARRQTMKE